MVRQTKSNWVFIPLAALVVALIVIFVPLAMRISQEAAPDTPLADATSTAEAVEATEAPAGGATPRRHRAVAEVAAEWGQAGKDSSITDPFDLPAGPTEFGFTFTAPSPFRVRLVRTDGAETFLVAEGTGPATVVQKIVTLETEGTYKLDIVAEGEWAFSVLHDSTDEVVRPR
jgi:hypothetical protein